MNKKILLVEDSPVIQHLTKRILHLQNFNIDTAKNGKIAIGKLSADTYDLILLDINMPVMDGLTCTQKIRSHEETSIRKIPIITITGNAKNYSKSQY